MSYVNGFASVVPLPGQTGSTAFSGAPELGGDAAAEASSYATNPDEAMSFAAAAPLRAPFFANGPGATADVKGGEGGVVDSEKEAKAKVIRTFADAILAGDKEKMTALLPSSPQGIVDLLGPAVKRANETLNGKEILADELQRYLQGHHRYGDGVRHDEGINNALRMVKECPSLATHFWTVLEREMKWTYENRGCKEFWDTVREQIPWHIYHEGLQDLFLSGFIDHIVANPESHARGWAQQDVKKLIWEPVVKNLGERAEKGEIDDSIWERIMTPVQGNIHVNVAKV